MIADPRALGDQTKWPLDGPGRIFIGRAIARLVDGPDLIAAVEARLPEILELAQALADGRITSFAMAERGEAILNARAWAISDWQARLSACMIDVCHPLRGEVHVPTATSWMAMDGPSEMSWLWLDRDEFNNTLFGPPARPREPWWPTGNQTIQVWCCSETAASAARARLAGRDERNPTAAALARELSSMWSEAGRSGGTWRSIETYRSSSAN